MKTAIQNIVRPTSKRPELDAVAAAAQQLGRAISNVLAPDLAKIGEIRTAITNEYNRCQGLTANGAPAKPAAKPYAVARGGEEGVGSIMPPRAAPAAQQVHNARATPRKPLALPADDGAPGLKVNAADDRKPLALKAEN